VDGVRTPANSVPIEHPVTALRRLPHQGRAQLRGQPGQVSARLPEGPAGHDGQLPGGDESGAPVDAERAVAVTCSSKAASDVDCPFG
jgi:hypothetical protein